MIERQTRNRVVKTAYRIQNMTPDSKVADPLVRMISVTTGEVFDVGECDGFVTCTCQDFNYRRINALDPCKHVLALRAVGKL